MKKRIGIWMIAAGAVCVGASLYIHKEVRKGKEQISEAETLSDTGKSLFSLTPETKSGGDLLTRPLQDKIASGKDQIRFYDSLANGMEIIGIFLLVLGTCFSIMRGKNSMSG